MEEVGVLGAVHQDLGPVPILGAPRAVPSRRLVAALPLQRGPLAARVAHDGGLRGHREAGRGLTPGKGQGTPATRRSQGLRGRSPSPEYHTPRGEGSGPVAGLRRVRTAQVTQPRLTQEARK